MSAFEFGVAVDPEVESNQRGKSRFELRTANRSDEWIVTDAPAEVEQ